MFNWAFNLNTVHNGYKTYQVHPSASKAWFFTVFNSLNGFSVSSGWWHCSSSWSALVPAPILKTFLRSWHGHPHSRWCGFQQFGRESMGNAWCLWYSTVVHLHPPTCSGWLRWIDHRSTPMTPWLSTCLDTSTAFFRALSLCMSDSCSNLLGFHWHASGITMFREGVLHIATSCNITIWPYP